jgi:methyl-accepting chemotaxis protein
MKRLNMTVKIWLSIGIFVLGYVLATVLGQVEGLNTESTMRATSDALFPAAQQSQAAETAFQGAVKGFSDAVVIQDADGLERAAEDGRKMVEGLHALAAIGGLSAERTGQAGQLASTADQFLRDARTVYGTMLSSKEMTADTQQRVQGLAARKDEITASLKTLKEQCSSDLKRQLGVVQTNSASQRWVALIVFGTTVLVAGIIVNMTIRRAITGPILRVIHGVKGAAAEAAHASGEMSKSGQVVAKDAQEQAACIEETSASLEEISATTRQNADRAKQADGLMREAMQTADKAAHAMNDLTQSMKEITKSSNQVAAVLKSIDEIAFHTNILALNASVEAARAGEAGAGFSVVADEVRSLAHRAADAARESAEIVEKTISDVKQGVAIVSLTHVAFGEVSAKVASGSQAVAEIAASSEEQSRGIANIGQAISRIESVTQNNVANAQRTAESASEMSRQVETTRTHIEELVSVVGTHQD